MEKYSLLIMSVVVEVMLLLMYFLKHGRTKENIFGTLAIVSILSVGTNALYMVYGSELTLRIMLFSSVIWSTIYAIYVTVLAFHREKNKKGIILGYSGLGLFLSIPIFIFPVTIEDTAYGLLVIYMMAISIIYMFINFNLMSHFIKKLKVKILIYLYYIVFISLNIACYYMLPGTLVISPLEMLGCLVIYLMDADPDNEYIEKLSLERETAVRASSAKSDFLSSMSHEIRTPLNVIVGLSEDMKDSKECPKSMREDLNDVVSASRTLLEIVGNIMDISKIESSKMELSEVPYNFKEEILALTRAQKVRIGDKEIEYTVNIDDGIPYELIGDKAHIKQVINNLVSNALKYTEEGYVRVNARSVIKEDTCYIVVSVKDSGIGIKKEDLDKLYTKFQRFDVDKHVNTEGTGLGLVITKLLVEMMHGKIDCESTYGKGSLFMVTIPQKISKMIPPATDEKLESAKAQSKDNDYSNKRILIVDDNKLNIKVARRNIEPLGFKVVDECYNGLECLEQVKEKEYDLILMDIMMPIMDGEEAMKKLLENKKFKTPVLALTADALSDSEDKYKNMGFTDYLSKPFTKDQIKKKVDQVFKKRIEFTSILDPKNKEYRSISRQVFKKK